MQTSRRFVIAVLLLLADIGGLSASGCGTPACEETGTVDYLVLFTDGTTVERVSDIVRQADAMILSAPPPGFSLEYKVRVPKSQGCVEDSAMFHRFPEVVTVVRAVNLQVH